MSLSRLYGIYGANGCGRGVISLAKSCLVKQQSGIEYEVVFVDDNPVDKFVNGYRVLTYQQFLENDASRKYVSVAIADPRIRKMLSDRCFADDVVPFSVTADNVVIMDEVCIGEGAILSPFVTLTSNIKIGRYFHANLYSYVEHDCVIGDFVTFAPAVKCNGNILIEDYAYIGAGAILRQGKEGAPLVIGEGAVIGMGAVVTKSVPPGITVIGNPARPFLRA